MITRAGVEELADDLLHIEVLTFVVDSIDTHVRSLSAAGLDEFRARLGRSLAAEGARVSETASFSELRSAAEALSSPDAQRIARTSARALALLGEEPDPSLAELDPRQRIELRRLLEVGDARCAARTVISLSGDVTNQLDAKYTEDQGIQASHHRAVQTAVSMWEDVIKTMTALFGSLLRGLEAR